LIFQQKGCFLERIINGVKQKGHAIGPAIAYQGMILFHGLQVVGTLAILRYSKLMLFRIKINQIVYFQF